jgi:hypothetical protein
MTKRYRNTIQTGEVIGVFMGQEKIKQILAQNDCFGIRFYFGIDDEGAQNLVLVGADEDENDLSDGLIADQLKKCPPNCSSLNPLNS